MVCMSFTLGGILKLSHVSPFDEDLQSGFTKGCWSVKILLEGVKTIYIPLRKVAKKRHAAENSSSLQLRVKCK